MTTKKRPLHDDLQARYLNLQKFTAQKINSESYYSTQQEKRNAKLTSEIKQSQKVLLLQLLFFINAGA